MASHHLDQRLRLHLLRAVDAIERQRSLVRAAAAIGVAQPSLTKSLRTLEGILGASLFERHARGMRPTEAGAAVAQAARRILSELRQLEVELERLAEPGTGTLSLGALPTAATGVLPGVIARLSKQSPGMKVRLEHGRTEELLPPLASGEITMVVGRLYKPTVDDDFVREALWSEPISVLARAGHPLLSAGAVSAAGLHRYELLLPSVSQRVADETGQLLALLGLDSRASHRSSSFGFIREMLHETDSLSVMPQLMMAGDLLRGSLVVIPMLIVSPSRPAGLITVARREIGPAARSFVSCLRIYLRELEGAAAPKPARRKP